MKILFLLIFLTLSLFSDQNNIKAKIIATVLDNLYSKEQKIVFSDDKVLLDKLSSHYKTTNRCMDSNFLILQHWVELSDSCKKKKIFVLNYNLLYDIPQSFGAFFFKKGRANVVLLKDKLEKNGITPSKRLEPYVEDKLW